MKTTTLIAASLTLAFAATGAAVAQEAGSDAWMDAASTKSRVEVMAELKQARADGSIKAYSAGYIPTLKASGTPRADVVAAVKAARQSGELDRIDAEAWGANVPRHGSAAGTQLARAAR